MIANNKPIEKEEKKRKRDKAKTSTFDKKQELTHLFSFFSENFPYGIVGGDFNIGQQLKNQDNIQYSEDVLRDYRKGLINTVLKYPIAPVWIKDWYPSIDKGTMTDSKLSNINDNIFTQKIDYVAKSKPLGIEVQSKLVRSGVLALEPEHLDPFNMKAQGFPFTIEYKDSVYAYKFARISDHWPVFGIFKKIH